MTDFIITLLNMSITAAVIALVVILLRLVFKKTAPKRLIVFLWLLVAVRLVCPVQIETDFSVMPGKPVQTIREFAQTQPAKPQNRTAVQEQEPIEDDVADDEPMPDETAESVEKPVTGQTNSTEKTSSAKKHLSAGEIAALVWAVGAASMLIYMVISYMLLHKQVRVSMRKDGNVFLADDISTSFILGLFRPRIYIPSYLTEHEAGYVLAHERKHIRHLDHLWKPFGFVLLAINWFNPILWFSYVIFCKDIELACDESVISKLDTDCRKEYSTVLLKCSMERHIITACPIAFGETGVKERVKAMKDYKKPTIIIIAIVVLIGALTAVLLLTSPKTKAGTDLTKSDNQPKQTEVADSVDLQNAPLPLNDGEELVAEWSHAEAMTDIDNDGKSDRVTYACIGEENNTVIVVEFGDRQKEAVRTYLEGDIIHPQMVLSKTGEDNLIYIHEKSQGSSGEELVYVFSCDKDGKIRMYDGKSEINNIYDACINKLPLFDLSIGNVKMLADDNAKIKLKYAGSELNLTIPKKTFEQNDYIGEYYVRLIQSDTLEINPQTNTVTYKLYAAVCYKPDKYYEELCSPASATMVLEYRNGMFDISSLSFEENPEFTELFEEHAATPVQSPTSTQEPMPSPSQSPTPTPKPSPTPTPAPTQSPYKKTILITSKEGETVREEYDLDGDGKNEVIEIRSDGNYMYSSSISSFDGSTIYGTGGLFYVKYALVDLTADGRMAVLAMQFDDDNDIISAMFIEDGKCKPISFDTSFGVTDKLYVYYVNAKDGKITFNYRFDLMGSHDWTHTTYYNVKSNCIELTSADYIYKHRDGFDDKTFTLTQKTYAYDKNGKKITLKKGTKYVVYKSDMEKYLYMKDESGKVLRFDIELHDGWTYKINGVLQDDLFKEIFYTD